MIKHLIPNGPDLGYYSASYRIIEGVLLFIGPMSQICFRYLRNEYESRERSLNLLKIMLLIACISSFFITLFGFIFGETITLILYGSEYTKAGELTKILFISFIFIIPNSILTQSALAIGLEKTYGFFAVIIAFVNIVINYKLIPVYGVTGSVLATILSEFLLMILFSFKLFFFFRDN